MQTSLLKQFWQDQDGATAIEYGLIAGLVAIVIIAGLTAMGGSLNSLFKAVSSAVDKAAPAADGAGAGAAPGAG